MPVRRSLLAAPVLEVAPKLLGMVLRRTTDEGTVAVRLTEVEAYDGPNDPGSHAYRGQTARNAVMFGPPGFLYVYFTYGMHFCMNVSAGPDGQPSAVLLRAGEVVEGVELARRRRGAPASAETKFNQTAGVRSAGLSGAGVRAAGSSGAGVQPGPAGGKAAARRNPDWELARGPARMCVALGIDREANGVDLLARDAEVQLVPGPGFEGEPSTGPRVGLREAADRPWRFWIPGDPTVSAYRPHVPKKRA
ncbi:DNA-3-methyladenine glycosylase [Kribbella flavida DSM 17836]|uniref:Putative 3-methyladenine DNA glycosylase n=1 Tax=Kribbella flavida (strain DSM 17836 / JCM 10339 / NBRC 14399) TaxID=479435 RepID=D2PM74_KRIFD|nr:DNA-3-methyladenine glycosylase [Kribbella flavida]ADB34442.1 DNA-3-methyladenine glycosylase [Kribbella flavida DSM 17836]